ncbi:hypothetical protein K5549_010108 [Capra hircus]|nr:hypothetical protein K5549_010108 [Capra hircus]
MAATSVAARGAGPAPAWGPGAIAPDWESRDVSTGTTLVAVQADRGMALGAGSRTTTESYIAKLIPVHNCIVCCPSGSAADTQAGADAVTYQLGFRSIELNEPPVVHTAASLLKETCLMAGIITAGWDPKKGVRCPRCPCILGSGSSYIYGYVNEGMTKEECLQLTANHQFFRAQLSLWSNSHIHT